LIQPSENGQKVEKEPDKRNKYEFIVIIIIIKIQQIHLYFALKEGNDLTNSEEL
jgi:hypothetical protein